MTKIEKIRELASLAYAGGCYHRGMVQREQKYVYFFDGMGNIERCRTLLYDAGCPTWEVWAHDTDVIAALAGRSVARYCLSVSMDSLFSPGGTKSVWDVYVDKYGAPIICPV